MYCRERVDEAVVGQVVPEGRGAAFGGGGGECAGLLHAAPLSERAQPPGVARRAGRKENLRPRRFAHFSHPLASLGGQRLQRSAARQSGGVFEARFLLSAAAHAPKSTAINVARFARTNQSARKGTLRNRVLSPVRT